jgi:NodT family efflux transporter outer membrane factor (OMF) lipoprotein
MKIPLLFVLALAGHVCSAADYLRRPMPNAWQYSVEFPQQLPSDDQWWRGFNDSVLDSLISMAEDANFNLAMACNRMEAARRQMDVARAAYYPQIGVQGSVARSRADAANATNISATATMSWQIDIFGKITQQVKQKRAQYQASRAEWVGAMVSMAGEIATNYVQLRVWQAEYAVAVEHISRQDTIANLAQNRYECGLASKMDAEQALTVLYSTRASLPTLATSINSAICAIALLVGRYPDDIDQMLGDGGIPEYYDDIATGVPSELLRRRPDIVQAEYNLAAAATQVGIAKSDFLPTLSLSGSVGAAAHRASKMFSHEGFTYSVAPTLSWTIFDGMGRAATLAAARSSMEALIDEYNYTVMSAYNEVDNAMTTYRNAQLQIEEYQAGLEASAEYLNLSLELYTQGLTEFSNVATAQVDYLNFANSLLVARGNAITALVDLYKALGGGFEQYNLLK